MSKHNMQTLNWQKGSPNETGLHFVAVRYGKGAGVFDFICWNGSVWDTQYEGEVVAYVSLQDFVRQIPIAWPEFDTEQVSERQKTDVSTDSWEEV